MIVKPNDVIKYTTCAIQNKIYAEYMIHILEADRCIEISGKVSQMCHVFIISIIKSVGFSQSIAYKRNTETGIAGRWRIDHENVLELIRNE